VPFFGGGPAGRAERVGAALVAVTGGVVAVAAAGLAAVFGDGADAAEQEARRVTAEAAAIAARRCLRMAAIVPNECEQEEPTRPRPLS
jgi:hypothetical protein